MIILPNGDTWIYDDKEHQPFPYQEIKNYNKAIKLLSLHTPREFCHIIVNDDYNVPRKWTPNMNGYWDANFSVTEVFDQLCLSNLKTDIMDVYLMPWKEVFVFYTDVDIGGYDAVQRCKVFKDKGEYLSEFHLK